MHCPYPDNPVYPVQKEHFQISLTHQTLQIAYIFKKNEKIYDFLKKMDLRIAFVSEEGSIPSDAEHVPLTSIANPEKKEISP